MRTDRRMRALLSVMAGACALTTPGCSHSRPAAEPHPAAVDSVSFGYGRQARRDVTGSISSIDSASLASTRVTRIEELLRGRVPGLEVITRPDGRLSVRIRGGSTLMASGGGEPLYVIDGMPLHTGDLIGALDGISPHDISRIEVLKDAGATAAYGIDGANGVILITTRRR